MAERNSLQFQAERTKQAKVRHVGDGKWTICERLWNIIIGKIRPIQLQLDGTDILYYAAISCQQVVFFLSMLTEFLLLPSGRRYNVPKSKSNQYSKSFIPSAIKLLNTDPTNFRRI